MSTAGRVAGWWSAVDLRARSIPAWTLGVLVALLAWGPAFLVPAPGLDVSWWSGLYMAAHDQLRFGEQIVFTYGPLGFLRLPWLFYSDLAALAYVYTSVVFVGFCTALFWTLRRTVGTVFAFFAALLIVALVPSIEQALALAILAGFGILAKRPGDRGLYWYAGAGGLLAAAEALGKLSVGPQILIVLVVALVCCGPKKGHLLTFAGSFLVGFFGSWFASGQTLSGLPDFALNSFRIMSGYNEAMAREVTYWWIPFLVIGTSLATLAWVWWGSYPGRRERVGAMLSAFVVVFASYKQGIVRADPAHVAIFQTTMAMVWLAVPVAGKRLPAGLAVAAALLVTTVTSLGANWPGLNVIKHVDRFADSGRLLVDSNRRDQATDGVRSQIAYSYGIEPRLALAMAGQSLSVEPWETMVPWAYGLDWRPPPVFQNYSAYTRDLDEMNAKAIASADGPSRILRERIEGNRDGTSIDDRLQVWDPPAQAVATLCHFEPEVTTDGWQLLKRIPDRCGAQTPIGSVSAKGGQAVPVPKPAADEVVLVRIDGAGLSPVQKLISLIYRPPLIHAVTGDGTSYRLVPATAGDGLMLRSGRRVTADRGRFSPIPQTRTIAVNGAGDDLEFEFFRMKVR